MRFPSASASYVPDGFTDVTDTLNVPTTMPLTATVSSDDWKFVSMIQVAGAPLALLQPGQFLGFEGKVDWM